MKTIDYVSIIVYSMVTIITVIIWIRNIKLRKLADKYKKETLEYTIRIINLNKTIIEKNNSIIMYLHTIIDRSKRIEYLEADLKDANLHIKTLQVNIVKLKNKKK
jgi:hypothetical protein